MDTFFKLKEKGTTVKTEVIAGLTTFATMAYILAVNVNILSATGLDEGALFIATALAAIIGTVAMALLANMPFALAPGMGLNAFFAYTVVLGMGFTPQLALAAVLTEGLIFIILSKTGIRKMLFNAIPHGLKCAVGAGIGMFIIFIGLKNAGVVVADGATFVAMGNLQSAAPALALIGTILTVFLVVKKVKGALLIGILATWFFGIVAQILGWYVVDPAIGLYDLIPSTIVSAPPSIAPTFGIVFQGFADIFTSGQTFISFIVVTFTFFFVDVFDTVGTVAGVATKAKMLNDKGELDNIDNIFMADAIATTAGAILGTSTTTTYVESAAGVQEGGRTGLTSLVVALLFGLSLFFSPLFLTIPGFATATALIMVGVFMLEPISQMDLSNIEDSFPLAITLITMPLFYSISHGLAFGFISYVLVKIAAKKFHEISPLMWILAIIFTLQMVFFG